MNNAEDRGFCNTVFSPQGSPTYIFITKALSYFSNLAFGQNGATGCFSSTPNRSALTNLVGHVVSRGTQEQVRWFKAGWIVTVMANVHACGNRPVDYFPRYSMHCIAVTVETQGAVARRQVTTSPDQAAVLGSLAILPNIRGADGLG